MNGLYIYLLWEMKNEYNILMGEPEEKRQSSRFMCIVEDNIKIDFKEI
jgi:hypothetical protein